MTQATYTDRVLRGEDGVYRWIYEMDMRDNRFGPSVLCWGSWGAFASFSS